MRLVQIISFVIAVDLFFILFTENAVLLISGLVQFKLKIIKVFSFLGNSKITVFKKQNTIPRF